MEENNSVQGSAQAMKPASAPHDTVLVVQDICHKSLLHVGPLTTAPAEEKKNG